MSRGAGEGEPHLVLDVSEECLLRDGARVPLAPKAFEVLRFLAARPGRLVTKSNLLDAVWPDTHVTEAVLAVAVGQLREALGDDARSPRFIETVHRRGYRWIGDLGRTGVSVSPGVSVPLGREQSLERLRSVLENARSGQRQVVFVTGEAGIGKTTLLDAFVAEAAARSWTIARGQCVDAYGSGEAYMPVIEALEGLCRGADARSAVGVLRAEAPSWLAQMPGVLSAGEAQDLQRILAASTPERMIREGQRALEAIAARNPLVLVLEDLHWSDRPTVALLGALAARREPARLLVVATLRSVDAIARLHPVVAMMRELVAKRSASELALEGLSAADIARYVEARLHRHALPAGLFEDLEQQTGGNPLFVIHAVEDFVQRGWLAEAENGWCLTVDLPTIDGAIPASTREMIDLRIDSLPERLRRLLEAASLVGVVFQAPLVAAAIGSDVAAVEEECSRLARDNAFVRRAAVQRWPDGTMAGAYAFGHSLYRQVLQARVGDATAAAMHQRIGERLAEGYGKQSEEVASQLAMHFELAGDSARAVVQRRDAARVATRRNAPAEAIRHLDHALAAVATWSPGKERDRAELDLRAAAIPPLFVSQGAQAERYLAETRRIVELSADEPVTLASLSARWALMGYHSTRGEFAPAALQCDEALRVCDDSEFGTLAAAVARSQRGFCRLVLGDLAGAVPDLESSLSLPPLLGLAPIEPGVMSAGNLAIAHLLRGEPDVARRMAADAWKTAEERGHVGTVSWATCTAYRIAMLTLDVATAARAAARGAEIGNQHGHTAALRLAEVGRAWAAAMNGDPAGSSDFSAACTKLVDRGYRAFALFHAAREAELLLRSGRQDAAAAVLARADQLSRSCDERWCDADLEVLRARVESARDAAAGRRRVREALDGARSRGDVWSALRAATVHFDLATSKKADARRLLEEALAAIRGGDDLGPVREARARLT